MKCLEISVAAFLGQTIKEVRPPATCAEKRLVGRTSRTPSRGSPIVWPATTRTGMICTICRVHLRSSPGTLIRQLDGGLRICLDPPDLPLHRRALAGLCADLNPGRPVFPSTDIRVHLRGSREPIRGEATRERSGSVMSTTIQATLRSCVYATTTPPSAAHRRTLMTSAPIGTWVTLRTNMENRPDSSATATQTRQCSTWATLAWRPHTRWSMVPCPMWCSPRLTCRGSARAGNPLLPTARRCEDVRPSRQGCPVNRAKCRTTCQFQHFRRRRSCESFAEAE